MNVGLAMLMASMPGMVVTAHKRSRLEPIANTAWRLRTVPREGVFVAKYLDATARYLSATNKMLLRLMVGFLPCIYL